MKRSNIVGGVILASALLAAPLAALASTGFVGDYSPSNATLVTASGGSIDTTGAPDSITLTGGVGDDFLGSDQLYQFTVAAASTLSFDWSWTSTDCCGPFFDSFGYRVNGGDFVSIVDQFPTDADPQIAQSGTYFISVNAGDTFAFDQNSFDNFGGPGVTVVSNFNVEPATTGGPVPEPAAWALVLSGFGLAGAALRRRRAVLKVA